ncbi:hatching enzyme 1.2-like isoform X2 [Onychostoma macrolepis]|uniref:hatching enzyme 1.2-like isoform X2 n=1 Tax=Onychostoma macrolepis TaxID=369639 RepID=UPI00272CC09F|nr:hatching enzyme 1.2-like isoform X2 [Onychostoma macrolepis]
MQSRCEVVCFQTEGLYWKCDMTRVQESEVLPTDQDIQSEKHDAMDIFSRILEANKEISYMLLEGDMALPKTRSAMKCLNDYCKWPKSPSGQVEVPYTIASDFYEDEKAVIENAMKSIASKTCVRFVLRTNQVDYISIGNLVGCSSTVGRSGGKQQLSLSVDGCVSHGIIEHELIHSLGFHHEHTRSDRDQYVQINWQNIPQASAYNFQKKDTNNLNTPYDYNSIMHYGRTAFAIHYGKETITPIPNSSVQIGQRTEMSNIDIQRINKLYECAL